MNLRWAGGQVLGLAVVGLAVGVAAGWIAVIRVDGAVAIARANAPFSYALVGLLPLTLIVRALLEASGDEPSPYDRLGPALGVLFLCSVLGAGFACMLFLAGSTQIAGVFGGEDAEQVMIETRASVGWGKIWMIVAATAVSSFAASLLAHARTKRR